MIVERVTWVAKVGCFGKVIQILKELSEQVGGEEMARIYSCMFGADDESVVVEFEFESMEHRRASWAMWTQRQEAQEATRRMRELIRTGGVHEVWRVHGKGA